MYRRNGKKAMSILLAAAMAAGLTACGQGAQNAKENETGTELAETPQDNNTSAGVYAPTEENGNQELTMSQQLLRYTRRL